MRRSTRKKVAVARYGYEDSQRDRQKEDESHSSDDSDDDYIGAQEPMLSGIDKQRHPPKRRMHAVFGDINEDRSKQRRADLTGPSTTLPNCEVDPIVPAVVHESEPIPIQECSSCKPADQMFSTG